MTNTLKQPYPAIFCLYFLIIEGIASNTEIILNDQLQTHDIARCLQFNTFIKKVNAGMHMEHVLKKTVYCCFLYVETQSHIYNYYFRFCIDFLEECV